MALGRILGVCGFPFLHSQSGILDRMLEENPQNK